MKGPTMDQSMTDCEVSVRQLLGFELSQPLPLPVARYIRASCGLGLPAYAIAPHVARAIRWPSILRKLLNKYSGLFSQLNTEADLKACFLSNGAGAIFLKMVADYVTSTLQFSEQSKKLQENRRAEAEAERQRAWQDFLKNVPQVHDIYFHEEVLIEFELLDPDLDVLKRQFIMQFDEEKVSSHTNSGPRSDG